MPKLTDNWFIGLYQCLPQWEIGNFSDFVRQLAASRGSGGVCVCVGACAFACACVCVCFPSNGKQMTRLQCQNSQITGFQACNSVCHKGKWAIFSDFVCQPGGFRTGAVAPLKKFSWNFRPNGKQMKHMQCQKPISFQISKISYFFDFGGVFKILSIYGKEFFSIFST